jgi:hypothetical protein
MSLPLPRPILLALLGLVAISAAFVATRGNSANEAAEPSGGSDATLATPGDKAGANARSRAGQAQDAARRSDTARQGARSAKDPAAVTGLPRGVAHAIARRRVIVLFFFKRGPADDTATLRSVRAVKAKAGRVAVFTDRVQNLSRYHRVVGDLGVTQAPAVVIVDRDLKAQVVEGFIDKESLLQQVRDARR